LQTWTQRATDREQAKWTAAARLLTIALVATVGAGRGCNQSVEASLTWVGAPRVPMSFPWSRFDDCPFVALFFFL